LFGCVRLSMGNTKKKVKNNKKKVTQPPVLPRTRSSIEESKPSKKSDGWNASASWLKLEPQWKGDLDLPRKVKRAAANRRRRRKGLQRPCQCSSCTPPCARKGLDTWCRKQGAQFCLFILSRKTHQLFLDKTFETPLQRLLSDYGSCPHHSYVIDCFCFFHHSFNWLLLFFFFIIHMQLFASVFAY
jgi:hypothetical protein